MASSNATVEYERPLTRNIRRGEPPLDIDAYRQAGGYRALEKALRTMTPGEVLEEVTRANLRGRGGAGFPAGLKWKAMRQNAGGPRYLVANADEMEPGAFKDRFLMEGDPHQFIEGIIVAAYAMQAEIAYIFLRASYEPAESRLRHAIAEAYARGYLGRNILKTPFSLELYQHTSAGRYICGESSALLNALEGKRAIPRAKTPRSTVAGLWGQPTVVNNVETLCNVPHILNHGAQWFLDLSRAAPGKHGKDGGTKIFGVSGRVSRPGAWELPMGTTMREVLEEHAGGMRPGYGLRALQPGGASTGFVLERHLDTPMDFDTVDTIGSRFGTGTMIVLDDRTCPVGLLHNLEKFFAQESCGWCTPCRDGLPWTERILWAIEQGQGDEEDLDKLRLHTRFLNMGYTFCAHAPGAMMPLETGLDFFEEEFRRHIHERRCPYH